MNNALRDEICLMHARLCSALAEPNRILLLYSLDKNPRKVSDLMVELQLPQPTISRHLKVLRESGLVSGKRQGHAVVYQLTDGRVIVALDMLRGILADTLKRQGVLARTATELAAVGQ
jgi:ArsR family transcriptional regulator